MGSRSFYGLLGALLGLVIIVAGIGMVSRSMGTDAPVSSEALAEQTATTAAHSVAAAVTSPSDVVEPTLIPTSSSPSEAGALVFPDQALDLLRSHTMTTESVYSEAMTTTTISTVLQSDTTRDLRRVLTTVSIESAAERWVSETETIYEADMAYQRQDGGAWVAHVPSQFEIQGYATDWLGGYGSELASCPLSLTGRDVFQGLAVVSYAVSPDCVKALEPGADLSRVEAELWATETENLVIRASIALAGSTADDEPFAYEVNASVFDIGVVPSIELPMQ